MIELSLGEGIRSSVSAASNVFLCAGPHKEKWRGCALLPRVREGENSLPGKSD